MANPGETLDSMNPRKNRRVIASEKDESAAVLIASTAHTYESDKYTGNIK
jgi:hypothetical protein